MVCQKALSSLAVRCGEWHGFSTCVGVHRLHVRVFQVIDQSVVALGISVDRQIEKKKKQKSKSVFGGLW